MSLPKESIDSLSKRLLGEKVSNACDNIQVASIESGNSKSIDDISPSFFSSKSGSSTSRIKLNFSWLNYERESRKNSTDIRKPGLIVTLSLIAIAALGFYFELSNNTYWSSLLGFINLG